VALLGPSTEHPATPETRTDCESAHSTAYWISLQPQLLARSTADLRTSVELSGMLPYRDATLPAGDPDAHRLLLPHHSPKIMLRTSHTIRSAQSQDGTVLLDVHHGRMFSINPIGSKILELIKEGRDESQIVDEIVRAYGVAIEIARTDVREFIDTLCAHRIVITTADSQNRR
jgi:hypothetical protein